MMMFSPSQHEWIGYRDECMVSNWDENAISCQSLASIAKLNASPKLAASLR